jgi:hypothetical protein
MANFLLDENHYRSGISFKPFPVPNKVESIIEDRWSCG